MMRIITSGIPYRGWVAKGQFYVMPCFSKDYDYGHVKEEFELFIHYYSFITVHSLLSIHHCSFITVLSLLFFHYCSFFTVHSLLFIHKCSFITVHSLLFINYYSFITVHLLLFFHYYSFISVHYLQNIGRGVVMFVEQKSFIHPREKYYFQKT